MAEITFNGYIEFISNSFRDGGCHYIFATFKRPSGEFHVVNNSWLVGWRVTLASNYGPAGGISIDDANPFIVPVNFTINVTDCVFASCDNKIVFYVIPCCRVPSGINFSFGSPSTHGNLSIQNITNLNTLANIPHQDWDGFAIYELSLNDKQYYYCNQYKFQLNNRGEAVDLLNSLSNLGYLRCNTPNTPLTNAPIINLPSFFDSQNINQEISLCMRSSPVNGNNMALYVDSDTRKTDCCFDCRRYDISVNIATDQTLYYFYQGCGPSNFGQIIFNSYSTLGSFNGSFCAIANSFIALLYDSGANTYQLVSPTVNQCNPSDVYNSSVNCPS